jgi:hypothetical protein
VSGFSEKRGNLFFESEELLVFRIAPGNVPGKGAEINDEEQYGINDTGNAHKKPYSRKCQEGVGNHIQHDENDHYQRQKTGELVCAVSALHKYRKSITKIF